ncbi:pre-toxin TG domain-containing protein [Paenibacillus sp. PsM32]|uniref:pre-toxin TG domain-containing protein n=1 Tax=Paenibacillus sp. PsM32 TaxID=3030536 RepID=UPI00263AB462|nr:pre-toxin TG domain-containing protein [Paenibacillus sp. PsM32]MDN4621068.1 pre-toxin TG domain-containing protein [Paenibacillus sp. PsM32]
MLRTAGSFLADAVLGLGTAKGLQEIFTGVNYITGEQLSVADRVANGGRVLLSWVPGGKIAGKALTKGAIDGGSWVIARVAKETSNGDRIFSSIDDLSDFVKSKITTSQRATLNQQERTYSHLTEMDLKGAQRDLFGDPVQNQVEVIMIMLKKFLTHIVV